MNFLSTFTPSFPKASATSILETDPNNLSPAPDLAEILISNPAILEATALASSTIFCSLKALCFKFSAKTFFAEAVANTANP